MLRALRAVRVQLEVDVDVDRGGRCHGVVVRWGVLVVFRDIVGLPPAAMTHARVPADPVAMYSCTCAC